MVGRAGALGLQGCIILPSGRLLVHVQCAAL